jgi:hypothetical protein
VLGDRHGARGHQGKKGGFVFNAIHNVQALSPVENVVAIMETEGLQRRQLIIAWQPRNRICSAEIISECPPL